MAVQSTYMYIDLIVIIIKSMGINVLCYNKYSGMCKAMWKKINQIDFS